MMGERMRWGLLLGLALILSPLGGAAQAQPVASLDRERITLGESVVLRIEASRLVGAPPDLSPLEGRVEVLQRSGRTEFSRGASHSVWEFTLLPREEGVVGIPALDWAGGRTAPLSLTVLPTRSGSAGAGDPIFIEVEIDDQTPYVQQALTYTLRLGYRVTLLEGRLDAPDVGDGASLRQSGEDVSYQRDIDGHRYRIVERRYVLVADRSGEVRVGPPRFQGRVQPPGSPFGAFQSVAQSGEALTLQVRPRPPQAASPWLPARSLRVRLAPPPDTLRQGEPVTLALRVRAEGATRDQLAGLALPEGPGYQVYPEAAELSERVEDGRLVVEGVRRFVVVPLLGERLVIPPSTLPWWDVANDQPAQADIPGLDVLIEPSGATPPGTREVPGAGTDAVLLVEHDVPDARLWKGLALLLGLAWLLTLVVLGSMLWRRPATGGRGEPLSPHGAEPGRRRGAGMKLRRALDEGDLSGVEHALLACAPGHCSGLAEVIALLADPAQRDAAQLLMQARWGGGDPAQAREAARRAFRPGPRWRPAGPSGAGAVQDPVPPLYPGSHS
ncbi:BatD family protein [Alkalisalibacterium limincola]|uniref:Protein BatD n=1 Tax=Alkalisalibacterium limincola TaxID=2699169 RepID=A0A5C8KSI1_9GAMM|nr:BatD family protein [Alkalisalibacterium limincola]TXK62528.1 protein BatD [Alkalisalibacterium limincola]